ncbi:MAG: asparagine synthase-related protein [Candidatus Methylarchaceae archaeon HK01B]|nr:asparagine synthase-related protein [Candidatus Methylarchaceae archaeon HK01B]
MLPAQINGIVALCGEENIIPRLISALKSLSHRAWSGYKIITEDGSSYDISALDKVRSNLAIGCCLSESKDYKMPLHGTIYHPKGFNFAKVLGEVSKEGLGRVSKLLSQLDGDFTFVMIKGDKLIFGRDPLGVKPLYLARDFSTFGVASEIKALKAAGFKDFERVHPGSIQKSSIKRGASFLFSKIMPVSPLKVDINEASDTILNLLSESIKRRVRGLDSVVIGFSGGLDSSLLALITSKFKKVTLLSIYARGSKDEEDVKKSARSLGLDLEELQIDLEQVRNRIGLVTHLIERDRTMDLSIGLGVNLAAEKCSQMGHKAIFLGQFADELFGGYAKYVRVLREMGEESAGKIILQGVLDGYKNNFERDEKASSPYAEVRLPYANIDLVRYALSLPLSLKIDRGEDRRKLVLKEVAIKAGLPRDIILKRKKAFQYSSGLQKLVRVAKY